RAQLSDKPVAREGREIASEEAAALAGATPAGEGSAIDLAGAVPATERPSSRTAGEGAAIDLGPATAEGHPRSRSRDDMSAIDLAGATPGTEASPSGRGLAGGSAIDLGGPSKPGGALSGSESGIDLEAEAVPDRPAPSKGDSGIDLVEEEIVLQET